MFINFYGPSEKCKALYSVNCILVSTVNFIHLLSAMGKNWFFYSESSAADQDYGFGQGCSWCLLWITGLAALGS